MLEISRFDASHRQSVSTQGALELGAQPASLAATRGGIHDQANGRSHMPSVLTAGLQAGPRSGGCRGARTIAPAASDGSDHAERGEHDEQPEQDARSEA